MENWTRKRVRCARQIIQQGMKNPFYTLKSYVTDKGVEIFLECIQLFMELDRKLSKLYTYAHLKHDEDAPKAISYIQDANYLFFINTAEKYSFYVDKNAPWRMVFNVSTKYALEKMMKYGINNLEEMFTKSYKPTYIDDWKVLRTSLVDYYNNIALTKQNVQIPIICNNTLQFENIVKTQASENLYNDITWIKLYYFVRLNEQNISLTQNEFDNKCRVIENLYSNGGELSALKFINNETKLFLDGGTNPSYDQHVKVELSKLKNNSSFLLII